MSASYIFLVLFLLAPLLAAILIELVAQLRGQLTEAIFAWTTPFYPMMMASEPSLMQRAAGSSMEYAWIGSLSISVILYGISVGLSSLLLPMMAVRHAPVRKPGVRNLGGLSGLKLLLRTPFLPFVLIAELIERKRRVGFNPVYWWEAGITGKTGRMQQL